MVQPHYLYSPVYVPHLLRSIWLFVRGKVRAQGERIPLALKGKELLVSYFASCHSVRKYNDRSVLDMNTQKLLMPFGAYWYELFCWIVRCPCCPESLPNNLYCAV